MCGWGTPLVRGTHGLFEGQRVRGTKLRIYAEKSGD
jgi:hypothetical protein